MTRELISKHFGEEWVDLLAPFLQSDDFKKITGELKKQKEAGAVIFPEQPLMFRAFKQVPLSEVRVIILNEEPYPRAGYANGLAFAHLNNMKTAPSLQKIIDAVEVDCYNGLQFDKDNFDKELKHWTAQGVLPLNTALSVVEDKVSSHIELWKPFTEYLVKQIAEVKRNIIWLAWGKQAQDFTRNLSPFTNFLYTHEHPKVAARESRSWECKHFSLTNATIVASKLGDVIKW